MIPPDSDPSGGAFASDGLKQAEAICLLHGVSVKREGQVLTADAAHVALRIGFIDGHYLVNIGVRVGERVDWVGFDPMPRGKFAEFLRDALPRHLDPDRS